jgi:hypothetical protein
VGIISRDGLPIDALEVTDTGHYRPQYDADVFGLPRIATDDSHRTHHVGRAWIEVEAVARERDAIIRAIKAGDFRLGFAGEGPTPESTSGRATAAPPGTPQRDSVGRNLHEL